jgi:hypothetical protein
MANQVNRTGGHLTLQEPLQVCSPASNPCRWTDPGDKYTVAGCFELFPHTGKVIYHRPAKCVQLIKATESVN